MVGENYGEFPADVDFLLIDLSRIHAFYGKRGGIRWVVENNPAEAAFLEVLVRLH
jgi:hypothetical protein